MWKCIKCETNNSDMLDSCMICNCKKPLIPKPEPAPKAEKKAADPVVIETKTERDKNPVPKPYDLSPEDKRLIDIEKIVSDDLSVYDKKMPTGLKVTLIVLSVLLSLMIIAVVFGIFILI